MIICCAVKLHDTAKIILFCCCSALGWIKYLRFLSFTHFLIQLKCYSVLTHVLSSVFCHIWILETSKILNISIYINFLAYSIKVFWNKYISLNRKCITNKYAQTKNIIIFLSRGLGIRGNGNMRDTLVLEFCAGWLI